MNGDGRCLWLSSLLISGFDLRIGIGGSAFSGGQFLAG
jgi:hypothetical protein